MGTEFNQVKAACDPTESVPTFHQAELRIPRPTAKKQIRHRWLTIPDAAPELGVSESTLRTWCNEKPPRIEHKREGTRGRGNKGTILIERTVIDAHNAKRRLAAAVDDADAFTVQHRKPRFISPHLEPEKYGLA